MKHTSILRLLLALILYLNVSLSVADTDSFRFALPESYQPLTMTAHSVHHGNILVLAPEGSGAPGEQPGFRNIRVLVLTDSAEDAGFSSAGQGIRAYASSILNNLDSDLDSDCEQSNVHVGSAVQLPGGLGIDWRRSCRSALTGGRYLSEQGRLFFADTGVYGLSQFGFSSSTKAVIPETERNWFAKFMFNSNFCRSGMNCGDEGYFQSWVEYQPEEPATPE
ncbi:hypothetical protein [Nitrincola sp. MINF-07-Sa-05]|uniref:hypothetical protein n=1 Tax=Nitrincola salilacus TaxID=3400273 RepID=UPI0039180563